MIAGAGSAGLNLTSAEYVVIAEQWWNSSVEYQTICQAWRQGQKKVVKVVRFDMPNSLIDNEICKVRMLKLAINDALMRPLIHKHDHMPRIVVLYHR